MTAGFVCLQLGDVHSLGALLALGDVEVDALVLVQGAEALALDGGVVDEQISTTSIGGDEAEALFRVEDVYKRQAQRRASWHRWQERAPEGARRHRAHS